MEGGHRFHCHVSLSSGVAKKGTRPLKLSTAIDTLRKKFTILSPSPGKLPSKVAIAGSIEWVDSE